MIKLSFCLRRRGELSREEFQAYWFDKHAPLVRANQEALAIRRYVQVHTKDDPLNETLQSGRGGPEPYDGIAELWWDSIESLTEAMDTAAGQVAALVLLEDEMKFIDLANSPLWIGEERVVIDG